MTLITAALRTELTTLYTSPSRVYHSLSHITSLLSLLSTHRAAFTDPEAVEAAIWFHDAIYDSHAKPPQNEVDSADLAVARLADAVAPDRLERIRVMIAATATHVVPLAKELGGGEGAVADVAMFLDMDLGILGAGEAEFDVYEAGVREEYAWVGEEGWWRGRGEVLRGFLGREWIFHSGLFRGLLEERARANLARSLTKLEGQTG
ncbi:hypothetical protein B0T25DRAFT_545412 [Lasiosphaeria hispida]|uniref:HD domain-containing protein n=1 Tax=Lasiosphaeria hispida TaxID=260671 RepID=A0AAJ0MES2_9PEZI|nr:hypothetical protein B0T25DRAFT_545412 [Lasiosphaeria hispida]